MKLTGFQVQMYKCVLDSKWINVSPLTVLVGKNESGKTTLLRALQKFNPFKPEPYAVRDEWPRAKRDQRTPTQIACTAEFELTPEEVSHLAALTDQGTDLSRLRISKDYAGTFEVHFPEGLFPERLHPNDIDTMCSTLPSLTEPVHDNFRKEAASCREAIIRLAREVRYSDLAGMGESIATTLNAARSQPHQGPQLQNENTFVTHLTVSLKAISKSLSETPSIHKKAHDYVISRLPTFVYMDEYRAFRGTILLDQLKQRKDQKRPTDEDKTFLTILELSGLDLDQLVAAGNQPGRDERQYDLSDAAATLTAKVAQHWGSLRYEVDFRVDGQEFYTYVRNEKDRSLIKLEERSRGFQWFFSFDLMLMHETKGTLKNCVILLDEPGLHLHPKAQTDLLGRLEDYAGENTLIYTTHLPFMIDLQEPDRIRVISETDDGAIVTEDLTKSQPDAKLTLQAALGMSARNSYLVADQNLVVEGAHDYWYITELSNLLVRSGRQGVPEGLLITPAGGAPEVTYLATFMIGQELGVVALYDSDAQGSAARDKLVKNWLTRYNSSRATALSLGEVLGLPERGVTIEDVFTEKFYLEHVHSVYERQLAATAVKEVKLPAGDQLCKRTEAFFDSLNIKFNKGSVAKAICASIRKMRTIDELPKEAALKAQLLIESITKAAAAPQGKGAGGPST